MYVLVGSNTRTAYRHARNGSERGQGAGRGEKRREEEWYRMKSDKWSWAWAVLGPCLERRGPFDESELRLMSQSSCTPSCHCLSADQVFRHSPTASCGIDAFERGKNGSS